MLSNLNRADSASRGPTRKKPRVPFPLAGPVAGLGAAALWGGDGPLWLLFGTVLGYVAEMIAGRVAAAERTEADRALAFFFVLGTAISLVPLVALGGLFSAEFLNRPAHLGSLILIPVVSATVAGIRYLRATSHTRPDRRGRTATQRTDTGRWVGMLVTFPLVLAIGWADFRMPSPYSLDFLYLLPVFAVTWATGAWGGVVLAVFSAEVHGIARGLAYSGSLDALFVSLDSLLIASGLAAEAFLLAAIRTGWQREKTAARTDQLTGLMNRKAFLERVEAELARSTEIPLSLVYLDLDGFKTVNDEGGHAAGDEALRIVAGVLRTSIREADVAARLGGDEFGILMPATPFDDAAHAMKRVQAEVEDRMLSFLWPVTCSVGMVTSSGRQTSVDELIQTADVLMYDVKHSGKNSVKHAVLGR